MNAYEALLIISGEKRGTPEQRQAINEALAQCKEDYVISVAEPEMPGSARYLFKNWSFKIKK